MGVGHYSLIILGPKPRYWSSYGYPVDFEISVTHSEGLLKDLLGDHVNDKIDYQDREHTQTCWKWCLLRASVHKMPEPRFKELFFSRSPRLKTPDDLVSVLTLGILGAEYMAGAHEGAHRLQIRPRNRELWGRHSSQTQKKSEATGEAQA